MRVMQVEMITTRETLSSKDIEHPAGLINNVAIILFEV